MTRPNLWGRQDRYVPGETSDRYRPGQTIGIRIAQAVMWLIFAGIVVGGLMG